MPICYKRVILNKSTLIFTIFSASGKYKCASFLDQLGAPNALQTFSLLTDQLKISYLQHCFNEGLLFIGRLKVGSLPRMINKEA